MKGKALRKHSLHEKTAASVLLKLFISSNKWCHTTDAPSRMSGTPFSNVNNIHVHSMIPGDQKNITTQWYSALKVFLLIVCIGRWSAVMRKSLSSVLTLEMLNRHSTDFGVGGRFSSTTSTWVVNTDIGSAFHFGRHFSIVIHSGPWCQWSFARYCSAVNPRVWRSPGLLSVGQYLRLISPVWFLMFFTRFASKRFSCLSL